jgi:hypothetical protein
VISTEFTVHHTANIGFHEAHLPLTHSILQLCIQESISQACICMYCLARLVLLKGRHWINLLHRNQQWWRQYYKGSISFSFCIIIGHSHYGGSSSNPYQVLSLLLRGYGIHLGQSRWGWGRGVSSSQIYWLPVLWRKVASLLRCGLCLLTPWLADWSRSPFPVVTLGGQNPRYVRQGVYYFQLTPCGAFEVEV